ncbi:TetR/AcrR family transcriptional regulator [Tomitella fengzijianii]|uniref:Helix-turn-helix transcriptional regulator n=1 Tax=Tomitella fengzijianii TaxID=2597660 RepID=A0A516X6G7_9ACTN|nr:helix-turn-helix domain-containing protein [Tomitella fengzijianii]QDQ98656.1 helix-turn-helix transcriptional regulator [Tomitella fengzijianii]
MSAYEFESTRRRLTAHQAETVAGLTEAAVVVLRERGYAGLTVRLVAAEAGVAPATAYTYFSSKSHLLAEVFWRRLAALPHRYGRGDTARGDSADGDAGRADPHQDGRSSRSDRVATAMRDVALLAADEPEFAAGVTASLLGDDPEVAHLRIRIALNIRARIARALAPDAEDPVAAADPEVLETLEVIWAGALLRAGMGHQSYASIAERLEAYVRHVVE